MIRRKYMQILINESVASFCGRWPAPLVHSYCAVANMGRGCKITTTYTPCLASACKPLLCHAMRFSVHSSRGLVQCKFFMRKRARFRSDIHFGLDVMVDAKMCLLLLLLCVLLCYHRVVALSTEQRRKQPWFALAPPSPGERCALWGRRRHRRNRHLFRAADGGDRSRTRIASLGRAAAAAAARAFRRCPAR